MILQETNPQLIAQFWQQVHDELVVAHRRDAQAVWSQIMLYRAELDRRGINALIYHLEPAEVAQGIARGRFDMREQPAEAG